MPASPGVVLVIIGLASTLIAAAQPAELFVYGLRNVTTQTGAAVISWKLRATCVSCVPSPKAFQIQWQNALGAIVQDIVFDGELPPNEPISGPDGPTVIMYRVRVGYELDGDVDSAPLRWSEWVSAEWTRVPGSHVSYWGRATWICSSPASTDIRSSMLRTEFTLPVNRTPVSATVNVIGLGQFQLRFNGADVGGDSNVPGWTTWQKRLLFSTYTIPAGTLRASPATNAVGVLLGSEDHCLWWVLLRMG